MSDPDPAAESDQAPEPKPVTEPWPGRPAPTEPFSEPWQAEVFALTVHLCDRGLFTWPEWADALSAQVRRPDAAADGSDYYNHWAVALQNLLADRGLASAEAVEEGTAAWQRAAHATPHGQPIELANDPMSRPG